MFSHKTFCLIQLSRIMFSVIFYVHFQKFKNFIALGLFSLSKIHAVGNLEKQNIWERKYLYCFLHCIDVHQNHFACLGSVKQKVLESGTAYLRFLDCCAGLTLCWSRCVIIHIMPEVPGWLIGKSFIKASGWNFGIANFSSIQTHPDRTWISRQYERVYELVSLNLCLLIMKIQ